MGILILLLGLLLQLPAPRHGRRRAVSVPARAHRRIPKPEWVRLEIIRLKAMMPELGCRKLAQTFNRIHSGQKETVRKACKRGSPQMLA